MGATTSNLVHSDPTIMLRDFQHAARIFGDDNFRLAPKYKFLFHTTFSINDKALRVLDLNTKYRNEIDLLVKSVSLPAFTVKTETVNQYNRKKVVQFRHDYNDIEIVFHDDNLGLVNQLWQNYYAYYYADSLSAGVPGAYAKNAMKNSNFVTGRYGLDNGSSINFFNYIKVYQMARHEYVCYTLINPMIKEWNHEKMRYEDKDTHTNSMKIIFESVKYDVGRVQPGDPEGFALAHYDHTHSPLTAPEYIPESSFVGTGTSATENTGILTTILSQINTVENSAYNTQSSQVQSYSTGPSRGVSGIQNMVFPQAETESVLTAIKRAL